MKKKGSAAPVLDPVDKEKKYQRDYYLRTREDRSKAAAKRWDDDPDYREREMKRSKDKRALARASTASDRFKAMVEARKADPPKVRPPRFVEIEGKKVWVYSTGQLAIEVGRDPETVREWIEERYLPCCSIVISGRYWFSQEFIGATVRACGELFKFDGRGDRECLRRLILGELEKACVSYVPIGKNEEARVRFSRGKV